jgi:hypothetical protein
MIRQVQPFADVFTGRLWVGMTQHHLNLLDTRPDLASRARLQAARLPQPRRPFLLFLPLFVLGSDPDFDSLEAFIWMRTLET